jgi:hypothetical protein
MHSQTAVRYLKDVASENTGKNSGESQTVFIFIKARPALATRRRFACTPIGLAAIVITLGWWS